MVLSRLDCIQIRSPTQYSRESNVFERIVFIFGGVQPLYSRGALNTRLETVTLMLVYARCRCLPVADFDTWLACKPQVAQIWGDMGW